MKKLSVFERLFINEYFGNYFEESAPAVYRRLRHVTKGTSRVQAHRILHRPQVIEGLEDLRERLIKKYDREEC